MERRKLSEQGPNRQIEQDRTIPVRHPPDSGRVWSTLVARIAAKPDGSLKEAGEAPVELAVAVQTPNDLDLVDRLRRAFEEVGRGLGRRMMAAAARWAAIMVGIPP